MRAHFIAHKSMKWIQGFRFARAAVLLLPVFCLSGGLAGCGAADDSAGKVAVYPVKGKVVLGDGQPLTSGRVYFLPLGPLMVGAEGEIKPDGSFTLITANSGEGAPAGEFRVRIEPAESEAAGTKVIRARRRKRPFPEKYADEETSGLKATVKPEPNDLPPFQLDGNHRRAVAASRLGG